MTSPLYRQIADSLRAGIRTGRLKPGEQLPTEMAICETHGISRHTAREALRILTEDGLIIRRRGSGTVVADAPVPAFTQTLGDFEDILQYAREARFVCSNRKPASGNELKQLGLAGSFVRFTGLRQVRSEPPVALTRVYVNAALAPGMAILRSLEGSISEWIETNHGIQIGHVTQRMEAVALAERDASALGVPTDSASLRTIRRYSGTDGAIVQLSESLHPAGRFAYELRLDRDG